MIFPGESTFLITTLLLSSLKRCVKPHNHTIILRVGKHAALLDFRLTSEDSIPPLNSHLLSFLIRHIRRFKFYTGASNFNQNGPSIQALARENRKQ